MADERKDKGKQVAVRFDAQLCAALERAAEREHRTLSGLIKHLCAIGLEESQSQREKN
jgi:hypothetical protein